MEWRDEGVLLAARPHGETSAIIEVFTAAHGRHAGVVRGGASRRMAPVLQPGAQVAVAWQARLAEHVGSFAVEPLRSRAALMAEAGPLAALSSLCALLRVGLPERQAHPRLWARTVAALEAFGGPDWGFAYLRWELDLLEGLGFGLDLSACAVTGAVEDLAYVSPRTGRAVSRAGAGDWADRLLPLPARLAPAGRQGHDAGEELAQDLATGLALTGHFLTRDLAPALRGAGLPEARARLVARLAARLRA